MTQQEIDQLPELLRRKQVMLLTGWSLATYHKLRKQYAIKIDGIHDPRTPKRKLLQLINS